MTGQVNFNSHTDTVVRIAVALVNLLTEGEDRSRKYRPPEGAERAGRLVVGNPATDQVHLGPIINEQQVERWTAPAPA